MSISLIALEIAVVGLALLVLLADLWMPPAWKPRLGYVAAFGLLVILTLSFANPIGLGSRFSFHDVFVEDGLAVFFDRLFLAATLLVVLMGTEFADRIHSGIAEFYGLILMALAGMMFSASANDFVMVFVSLELITVSFYVLVSFQRARMRSLEAGVKYLIIGAMSTAFLVFGIALIFGVANTTNFVQLSGQAGALGHNKVFWLGILFVLIGFAFKISAFPMQMWAPDVYQGAPVPVTAFLAVASKAAGFVLLLRVLFVAVPYVSLQWSHFFMLVAAVTILYGNLCAIPQRNLKRLLGYSSVANAGYLLLGVVALSASGTAAILYFLASYLFTLSAAFIVICIVCRQSEEITSLAGLNQRSPMLAAAMTMAMVSLGGVPPLAGFIGKFLLLKALVEQGAGDHFYYLLAFLTVVGVVISYYYYFGVIRSVYWSNEPGDLSPISLSPLAAVSLIICMAGMIYLGICPGGTLASATAAVNAFKF
jgi:NADH-quinone oxidoreductase subunit N